MPLELSILIACGDEDVADFLDRQMLKLGCHTVAVSRHTQALSATDARDFHLALVAEQLEDGSGLDVVEALRRRYPRLTVYLMASQSDPQLDEQARRRGATRCVVRPTHGAAVETLLEDALEEAFESRSAVVGTAMSRRDSATVD